MLLPFPAVAGRSPAGRDAGNSHLPARHAWSRPDGRSYGGRTKTRVDMRRGPVLDLHGERDWVCCPHVADHL